ncbi:hypothetical protein FOZ63_017957, partial [Perkinsus olseni]
SSPSANTVLPEGQFQYEALNLYSAICASNGTPPVPVGARSLVLLVRNAARLSGDLHPSDGEAASVQLALRAAERDVGSAVAHQVFRVTRALDVVDVGFGDGFLRDASTSSLSTPWWTQPSVRAPHHGHNVEDPSFEAGVDDDPVSCSSRFCAAHCLLRRAASAAAPVVRLFPFAYSTFNDNLKSAMARVLDLPQAGIRLSSHTMRRSGSAICCGSDNFATPTVAGFGRWASTETLENVYLRDIADAFNRFVVGLLATWSPSGA